MPRQGWLLVDGIAIHNPQGCASNLDAQPGALQAWGNAEALKRQRLLLSDGQPLFLIGSDDSNGARATLLLVAAAAGRKEPAALDRLTHRCHILETKGESYRPISSLAISEDGCLVACGS